MGAFNPPVKQDNPDPRVACALLLDTSYSMKGERIEHLNAGFATFCASIAEDPLARKRTDVTVVTFGGVVEVAVPFQEGRDLTATTFTAQGATPLGEALDTGLDLLAARKSEYKEAGLEYYRPWLFVITDGMPTDEQRFAGASTRVRQAEAAKQVTGCAGGAGDADLETLSRLSAVREPLALNGMRFEELCAWLSTSMSVVTQSSAFGATDATVAATEAAEQVPLPPPSGWATW